MADRTQLGAHQRIARKGLKTFNRAVSNPGSLLRVISGELRKIAKFFSLEAWIQLVSLGFGYEIGPGQQQFTQQAAILVLTEPAVRFMTAAVFCHPTGL